MKFKLTLVLILSISLLLTACGYSNMVEDTGEMTQHNVLKGVITDVNHSDKQITVENETEEVVLQITEDSRMVNLLEEVVQFEELNIGLEVSVSWLVKDASGQNQVDLEELQVLEE